MFKNDFRNIFAYYEKEEEKNLVREYPKIVSHRSARTVHTIMRLQIMLRSPRRDALCPQVIIKTAENTAAEKH